MKSLDFWIESAEKVETIAEEKRLKESLDDPNFFRKPEFWRDGNPLAYRDFVHRRLKLEPSDGQLEEAEKITGTDSYEWDRTFQKFAFAIGQGGGKNTYIIGPITVYLAYKILNMKNPTAYFGRFIKMDEIGTKYEISNSSLVNAKQAESVHFETVKRYIENCKDDEGNNWFEQYTDMDLRRGVGDIRKKEISLTAGQTEVVMHSFDSTPGAPEGLHLVLGIIDEPSRADTQASFKNAEALWNMIVGNVSTRFSTSIGKAVAFSYLNNSEWDLTYALLEQAQEEERLCQATGTPRTFYYCNRSSFEMNPNQKRDSPEMITAYRNNPQDAAARYEGIKGKAREGFYQPHPEKIAECFYYSRNATVEYECYVSTRAVEDKEHHEILEKRFSAVNIQAIQGDGKIRGWALDPAEKFDAFILKGGYIEDMDPMKDEIFIKNTAEMITINKRPILDICIAWQPQQGLPIDHVNVGEVLGLLLDKFPNSYFVVSDKWNSVKLGQEVTEKGILFEALAFGNAEQMRFYTKLRWMIHNNIPLVWYNEHTLTRRGITKYAGEWNRIEHESLIRINNNKVDHPPNSGSKDFADVDAILAVKLTELEVSASEGGVEDRVQLLMSRALIERQECRNLGIHNKEDQVKRLAEKLYLSLGDAEALLVRINQEYQF